MLSSRLLRLFVIYLLAWIASSRTAAPRNDLWLFAALLIMKRLFIVCFGTTLMTCGCDLPAMTKVKSAVIVSVSVVIKEHEIYWIL